MPVVLIDTCMWVPFFNRPHSTEKKAIDALLDDDQGAVIGPIVAEILQGISREAQADYVASVLRGVRYENTVWEDWLAAARLGRRFAATRQQLPLSDLVLAAVSLRTGAELYSTDPHFDLVPELKRFRA
jgi:predicted nucleic acid-binding protein